MLEIKFKTSGDAFRNEDGSENENYKRSEIIRLLKEIQDKIENGRSYSAIMDINGNKCGEWELD